MSCAQVSPHEFMQAVMAASDKRYTIDRCAVFHTKAVVAHHKVPGRAIRHTLARQDAFVI